MTVLDDNEDIEQELEHSDREASSGFVAFANLDLAPAARALRRMGPVLGAAPRPTVGVMKR